MERGQGVVEFVLIAVLGLVVLIVILALAHPVPIDGYAQQTFTVRDQQIGVCVASERYTREECIQMAAGR